MNADANGKSPTSARSTTRIEAAGGGGAPAHPHLTEPRCCIIHLLLLLNYLRGVELVGQLVENASARLRHGEEPFEREWLHPRKVGARGQHAASGGAVAAKGYPLDLSLPGREHAGRFRGRLLDELAFLPFAATAEAVGRGAAGAVAALDEA